MASRANVYKDYFGFLSEAAAMRVLLYFALGLLALEAAMRIADPRYERTAISSLHGVRSILQQALEDPGPKVLCFGDSAMVGGGIYRHDETVAGRLGKAIDGPRVYNLALPGGDSVTSALLLEQLRDRKAQNVDRVILETLAGKWVDILPEEARVTRGVLESGKELRRQISGVDLDEWHLGVPPMPISESTEVAAQWALGDLSMLYRHRDYFRTEVVGNYPSFWAIGKLLPRSLMTKLNPAKARGMNRLAARADDFTFDPADAKPGPRQGRFSSEDEEEALRKDIELAKGLSKNAPILLAFPMFHELQGLGPAEKATFLNALREFENHLAALAVETGCELMLIRSEEFQNPADWTATPSHFNAQGAGKIWEQLRPRFCEMYRCK